MSTPSAHITIGKHKLEGRAFLAPMSGVTDHGFRREAEGFGASLVVSEMVAADALVAGNEEARLRAEGEGIALHVVQLAGCEATPMAEGARVAEASGADIIDINMGCPAKKVVNGWSGSALMRDLDHAQSLIEAVRKAVSVPVTLNMRLGWDHASLNAPELARRAEENGLSLVTIHGRTRQQFYKGKADWHAVAAVRAATRLPMVVNGDIGSLADARIALIQSGADAVMIGRAALGRPWLVGEIAAGLAETTLPETTPATLKQAVIRHYCLLLETMGIAHGLRHARKHVAAYAEEAARRGAILSPILRAAALQSEDPDIVLVFLSRCFDAIPDGQGAA